MNYSTSRSPSPTSPAPIHRRSLVQELQIGHRAAEQLRRRLIRSPDSPPTVEDTAPISDFDLAEAILNSFNNSISIARNCESSSLIASRLSSGDCKIEDSGAADGGGGESSRIKDRRGCYKRRKRGQSWTTEGETPNEDCYAWRKYGQKIILNAKYPRNYYRCTHKTDQGCQATRQVQKISEDPPVYRTTYHGQHTCKNPLKTPQIIIPSSSPDRSDSSFLLSFERTSNNIINGPFFPPSNNNNSTVIKQEQLNATADQAVMMNIMMMINQSSSSDYNYLSSPDPAATLSGGARLSSTPAGSDHGGDGISAGNYSCSTSPHSTLEIDNYMMLDQDHPLDLIQFDCDIV